MVRIQERTKCCSKCKQIKAITEFSKKTPKRLQAWCKQCSRENSRKHYLANKSRYLRRIRNRRLQLRAWLRSFKSLLKCGHCGENHPACLAFHHNDPSKKEVSVSHAINICKWGIPRIKAEIAKCTVLCANCHAKLHWSEG